VSSPLTLAVFSEANARAGKTQASSVLIGIFCTLCVEECLGTSLSGSPQRFLEVEMLKGASST